MGCIFVGNLDFRAREEDIRVLFENHGAVFRVEIATDWETGHSRGFAFVQMVNAAEAETAISELNGVELDGRSLTVGPAPSLPPIGFDSLHLSG